MKIVMRTIYAGPSGTWGPGSTMTLPDAEAQALIDGGYATAVVEMKRELKRQEVVIESAVVEPEENTMMEPPRRRRRKDE